MQNYSKRFSYEFNNIARLNEFVIYISTVPGMEEFFHLTINNLSNTNLIAFSVISMGPSVIDYFLKYLDFSCFFSLKDKSYLLEYEKHVIIKDNNSSGVWSTTNEETPSWVLSTGKIIFICPGILPYDLETVRLLIEFTLDSITLNG